MKLNMNNYKYKSITISTFTGIVIIFIIIIIIKINIIIIMNIVVVLCTTSLWVLFCITNYCIMLWGYRRNRTSGLGMRELYLSKQHTSQSNRHQPRKEYTRVEVITWVSLPVLICLWAAEGAAYIQELASDWLALISRHPGHYI